MEIRALHPRIIRLFVQEYFDVMPAKGRYNFASLDRSVDLIRAARVRSPLLSIDFKPKDPVSGRRSGHCGAERLRRVGEPHFRNGRPL